MKHLLALCFSFIMLFCFCEEKMNVAVLDLVNGEGISISLSQSISDLIKN